MANEISYQFQIRLANGSLSDNYSTSGIVVTQNTASLVRNVQTIGFAVHSLLDLGSLATPGFGVFVNLDDTNYVEIGIDTGPGNFNPFLKLKPANTLLGLVGEQAGPIRLGTSAIYAKANTGAVKLFYIIYND